MSLLDSSWHVCSISHGYSRPSYIQYPVGDGTYYMTYDEREALCYLDKTLAEADRQKIQSPVNRTFVCIAFDFSLLKK